MSLSTGTIVPAACRSNRCGWCGPRNAQAVAGAVALAAPERFGTLTLVGEDWQAIRGRMRRLRYDLGQSVGRLQWCWHVEGNPAGTGHHVHFWQRGDFIPQAELSRMAKRRGCGGVVDIRRWRATPGRAVGYGVKMTGVFYGIKTSEDAAGMSAYLDTNGGRLVHASRGWWLDRNGAPCTQRTAMEEATRSSGLDDEGPWELVAEGTAGVLGALLSRRASWDGTAPPGKANVVRRDES